MAKFLDTTGISYHLETIIKNSTKRLVLISPFLKINDRIKDLLEDKDRLKIDIRVVYGKNELKPEESNWLNSKNSIRTSFCKNLHAKCYLNSNEALVTSMNLYEFSQNNNNEMGIYVKKDEDESLYNDIHEEANRLIRISEEVKISIEMIKEPTNTEISEELVVLDGESGHCIRCDESIELNPLAPYCKECYRTWNKYQDEEYLEEFCHICGKDHDSSMLKPTCYSCYKKNKNVLEFNL